MLIGVDFDNTIVRYDTIFHSIARERGLIPATVPVNKAAVRDYIRAADRESAWTEMQGHAYGPGIMEAEPFIGVWDFFRRCVAEGAEVRIVSHKTRYPYLGPKHDLHAFTRAWIEAQPVVAEGVLNVETDVFLEATKADKLQRIGALQCDWFIDDLPEFLSESAFPTSARAILFDPEDQHAAAWRGDRATSWAAIAAAIFEPGRG